MGAAARNRRSGFRRGDSVLFSRHTVGPRSGISLVLVARSSWPMEAGDILSTVGRDGTLRLRRAAICVLSAGFVDTGRGTECDFSVDRCVRNLHMDCAGGGRGVDVRAGAAM